MRKNSIPKKILLAIGESLKGGLEAGAQIIFDWPSVIRGFSLYHDFTLDPPLIYKGIWNLKRYGYLKEKKIRRKKKFYLTPKGKAEIIRSIIRNKKDEKLKWDGKWRMIIFDIPELSRKDRDFLRRELRWIGFKELQKSVWVFPYEFGKELMTLLKIWKIEFKGSIRFLRVEKMDEDQDLKKYFQLE